MTLADSAALMAWRTAKVRRMRFWAEYPFSLRNVRESDESLKALHEAVALLERRAMACLVMFEYTCLPDDSEG